MVNGINEIIKKRYLLRFFTSFHSSAFFFLLEDEAELASEWVF